jgi:hypothetical protein
VGTASFGYVWNGATWDRAYGNAAGGQYVQGAIASGVADTGNPVKVGGVIRTAQQATKTAGTRGDLTQNALGELVAAIAVGTVVADGLAANAAVVGDYAGVGRPLAVLRLGWNGASSDRLRTPNVFKTATATAAGSLAVWTPAAGKKFRLMAYEIEVTANASLAAGGINTFTWLDAAAAIGLTHSDFEPTTAVTTGEVGYSTGWITLGNGYLSSAANNVLNLSILTALVTGALRVNAIGTEE